LALKSFDPKLVSSYSIANLIHELFHSVSTNGDFVKKIPNIVKYPNFHQMTTAQFINVPLEKNSRKIFKFSALKLYVIVRPTVMITFSKITLD